MLIGDRSRAKYTLRGEPVRGPRPRNGRRGDGLRGQGAILSAVHGPGPPALPGLEIRNLTSTQDIFQTFSMSSTIQHITFRFHMKKEYDFGGLVQSSPPKLICSYQSINASFGPETNESFVNLYTVLSKSS